MPICSLALAYRATLGMANLQEVIHYALAGSRVKPANINSRFLKALVKLGLSIIFLLMAILSKLGKS